MEKFRPTPEIIRIKDYNGFKSQAALFNATYGWLVYMLTCKSAQIVRVCGETNTNQPY